MIPFKSCAAIAFIYRPGLNTGKNVKNDLLIGWPLTRFDPAYNFSRRF